MMKYRLSPREIPRPDPEGFPDILQPDILPPRHFATTTFCHPDILPPQQFGNKTLCHLGALRHFATLTFCIQDILSLYKKKLQPRHFAKIFLSLPQHWGDMIFVSMLVPEDKST